MMSMKSKRAVIGLLICCCALAGCTKRQNDAEISEVKEKNKIIYGSVKAEEKQEIIVDFQAGVLEVDALEGEKLKRGDSIISLDMSDHNFWLMQKEQQLNQYQASLHKLENQEISEKEQIGYLRSQLDLKKGYLEKEDAPDLGKIKNEISSLAKKLDLDRKNYESGKILYAEGAISENDFENLEYAYKNTQSLHDSALLSSKEFMTALRLEVQMLESRIRTLESEIKNSEEMIRTEKELLRINIEMTKNEIDNMKSRTEKEYIKEGKIVATRDDTVISEINCQKGSKLSAERGGIVELIFSDSLYVQGEVLEDMHSEVHIGDRVDIRLADHKEMKKISGTVVQMADKAIEKDGDTIVLTKIRVDEGKEYLKEGLSVDIYLEESDEPKERSGIS